MKKLAVILILSLAVSVSGCGNNKENNVNEVGESSGVTADTYIEIPITDTSVIRLGMTGQYTIIETDNNKYWLFDNGVTLYATAPAKHTSSEYVEDLDIYMSSKSVCKDFEEVSIVANADGKDLDTIAKIISSAEVINKNTALSEENEIDDLPIYSDMSEEMYLNKNNLYVPNDTKDNEGNIYISALYCDKESWLQTWVQDGTYKDIKDKMVTLVLNNSGVDSVQEWYDDGTVVYMSAGKNLLAMKKLLRNEWYIYYCSMDLKDYALTGIEKVKSSRE